MFCLLLAAVPFLLGDHRVREDKNVYENATPWPKSVPSRPLVWGDVNFIHTTDTHGTRNHRATLSDHLLTAEITPRLALRPPEGIRARAQCKVSPVD